MSLFHLKNIALLVCLAVWQTSACPLEYKKSRMLAFLLNESTKHGRGSHTVGCIWMSWQLLTNVRYFLHGNSKTIDHTRMFVVLRSSGHIVFSASRLHLDRAKHSPRRLVSILVGLCSTKFFFFLYPQATTKIRNLEIYLAVLSCIINFYQIRDELCYSYCPFRFHSLLKATSMNCSYPLFHNQSTRPFSHRRGTELYTKEKSFQPTQYDRYPYAALIWFWFSTRRDGKLQY